MCFWIVGITAKRSGKLLLIVDLKSQQVSEGIAGCVFLAKLPQPLPKAGNGSDWMTTQPLFRRTHINSAFYQETRRKRYGYMLWIHMSEGCIAVKLSLFVKILMIPHLVPASG